MESISHDWIENFAEYEAVLVCQNELPTWDRAGVMRAFQTYGWNDGSTPGNDSTFSHESSGLVVRHDGKVVAIDFSHGELGEAIADLFVVLHALGWHVAHVYHPPETINQLLVEIGRAIPAGLNFDVQPAPEPRAISGFAEGASLIARSKTSMHLGGLEGVERTVMDELRSMDAVPAISFGVSQPISLEDDAESVGDGNDMIFVADGTIKATPFTDPYYSEEPGLVVLPGAAPQVEQGTSSAPEHWYMSSISTKSPSFEEKPIAPHEPKHESIAPSSFEHEGNFAMLIPSSSQPVGKNAEPVEIEIPKNSIQGKDRKETATQRTAFLGKNEVAARPSNIVSVGNSVFCFDIPEARLSGEEIAAIASNFGIYQEQLFEIHLGALNARIRWNVLGEITPEYPGFAEKLAALMNFGFEDRVRIAIFLLTLKHSEPHAQLRDVLMTAISRAEMRTLLSDFPPAKDMLLSEDSAVLDRINEATIQRLGPLALIPSGQAFVDLPVNQAESGEQPVETFTVFDVVQSALPRMFVLHVDELDSQFVVWMSKLLQAIALMYSATNRYKHARIEIPKMPIAEPIDIEKVKQETAQQAMAQVHQLVGGLVEQLSALISVPAQVRTEA